MCYGITSIRKPTGEETFTEWYKSLTEQEKENFKQELSFWISQHKHPRSTPQIEILEFIDIPETPKTETEHDETFQHHFQEALKKYSHSILAEYCASDFKNPVLFIYRVL